MKISKNLLICALLVLVMLCIVGTASAAEPLSENMTATDVGEEAISDIAEEPVAASDSGDELSAEGDTITVDAGGSGDYTTISAAVSAANGGETIFIKNGEYSEAGCSGIKKQLTFTGESQDGVIIKTTGSTGFFTTTESGYISLSFNKLTFKDINGGTNAAINIGGDGDVNIINCTFDSCYARYGSIRIFTSGSALIDGCTIVNSQSSSGSYSSAIHFGGTGNAHVNEYTLKNTVIDSSSIKSTSTASYIVAVVYNEGSKRTLTMDNVTISDCISDKCNGLIVSKGKTNIKNSRIINNQISRDGIYGLIFVNSANVLVSIETTQIENNTGSNYLLTTNSGSSSFNLTNNNIQGNEFKTAYTNPTYPVYDLNANYWGSNTLPDGVTASTWIVEYNGAYELNTGEAIDVIIPGLNDGPEPKYPEGTIYVSKEGNDENNGSEDSPVLTIAKGMELANAGSGFLVIKEGNYLESNIELNNSKVISIVGEGNVVIDGQASSKSIFVMDGGEASFTNIKFTNNNPGYGGAINLGSNKEIAVLIDNCTFADINSTSRGGAIYGATVKGKLTVKNSNFYNIDSGSWGAITIATSSQPDGLTVDISGSNFKNNKANNGAALYLRAANVNIVDSTFVNNTAANAPGAIYLYNATATIDNCIISNNTAGAKGVAISTTPVSGSVTKTIITNSIIENNNGNGQVLPAIYADMNMIEISYSSLINELSIETRTATGYDAVYGQGVVIANNNWWGVNDPSDKVTGKNITVDSWVIMNVEANVSEVLAGDEVKLTIDFNHVNTTSGEVQELTGGEIPIDSYTVHLTSQNGTFSQDDVVVKKGKSQDVIFTSNDNTALITATSGDATVDIILAKGVEPYYGIIYVSTEGNDNNNGSEAYPVASIAKAIELASINGGSGEIIVNAGTYTGANYEVTKDLTVTGVGDVILNAEGQGKLFNVGYSANVAKLSLANLTLTGGNANYGSVIYSYAKELILENVNVINNPTSGNLITNNGKLTVSKSKFANNTCGDVIKSSGNYDITITNSTFENNTVTGSSADYGIVYISSGKGNLIVENSKFINNVARQGVLLGSSDTIIDVKGCEFINNTNTVSYGGAIRASSQLTVTESKFINNKAFRDGGAIYVGFRGDATVTKSVFINNTVTSSGYHGDAIYNGNKLSVNYCVLLTNGTKYIIYNDGEDNVVNAQYNWWGTNDNPSSLNGVGSYEDDWGDDLDCADVDSSNWVVMTVSNNLTGDSLNIGDNVEFTVDFTHANSNQELSELIPEVEVDVAAVIGDLDAQKITTENNVAKFTYTALEGGEDTVTITSSNAVNTTSINVKVPVILEVIYVSSSGDDNNNGTRSSPVATLEHAIEIAQRGKIVLLEGNYSISQTITLEKDMDIKGEGTVIINGNKTKIFNNNADLNLTNIRFTNASAALGSVVDNVADKTLVITGCEFYSNAATGTTGGIIHIRKGTLNLTDSKFYENTIKRGVVSAVADTTILIADSEFFNHTTTQTYGLIKLDGLDATIKNTTFANNSIGNGAAIYITSSKTGKVIKIDNNTFIDNKATHSSSGNGGAIFVNIGSGIVDLTISNSKFINNTAAVNGGAIYTNGNNVDVEVDSCTFINNTAKAGSSIYVNAGKFSISNSVILDDDGVAIEYYNQVNTNNIIANDNFWGDNAKANVADGIKVSSWIIMNAAYTTSDEGVLTITATFDKTNSTTGEIADYAGKLPDGFDVTFISTSGKLNEVVTVKDGKATVDYTRDEFEDSAITVKVANDEVTFPFAVKPSVIYVSTTGDDNNDGSRDAPVSSLAHALEIAEKGQIVLLEGTYKTGDLGIISNNLNITGEGKVVIDADNSNRILYVGEDAKVVLKNLIMINGYKADESGALLGNSNYLTLINCTLANSTAGEFNGGAIYNVGYLTVINSTIANNTAKLGGAIYSANSLAKGATISIENSVIENNTAKGNDNNGGGAIFAQQIAGMTIDNTTFKDNKALTTSSGGAIFVSHFDGEMKVTNSKFIANHANGKEGTGGGAIYITGTSNYERKGKLTVSDTLFENNTADTNGGAIYARATTVNVEKSVFINNTDENGIAVYGYKTEQIAPSMTANKNWWGTNDDPSEFIGGNSNYKPTLNNWAVLTITNDTEIKDGNTVKLTVAIDSYTDGETVTKMDSPVNVSIPVIISTNKGDIEGALTDGEFTYDLDATGIKFISANIGGVEEVLFANTVDTSIVIEDVTASKGDEIEYTVTVTSADGTVVNKGIVELYFDNELVKTIEVIDGVAKDKVFITKEPGKYNITAKYIDETDQFANSEENKTLTVSGINNVVTPENFHNFFDENGVLKDEVPFDEIFFKGTFDNLGVITIDKEIKLTGDGAIFNNASFKLDADNIELSNVAIVLDKNFDETDGAAVYIGGDNVVLSNNNITYNAPDNVQSYAIEVDMSDDVKIINNNINYSAKSDGTVKTMGISAVSSDNLVIENNVLNANIPSVDLDYSAYPIVRYYSQGVHVENSDNVSFNKNKVTVNYTNATGYDDTIYAVHFDHSDDSRITNNDIELNGHKYAYGLVTNDCDNITISGNDIKSSSDAKYASGLQVGGKSTAVVDNNNISAKANDVTYPVYLDDWGNDGEVNLTNNNIKGESDTVYGVYVEENKTLISGNTIDVEGNHVYGVVTHQTDVVIESNNITANGKDVGDIVSPQSGVNENTTGIIVSEGSAVITNNNVITNGQSAVTAINTNATINNNGLTANGTTADKSIKNINSNVNASGNTAAKNGTTPKTPVIKITGKNKAKVDYGFTYKVRVTQDGKSVGAGKVVTLKIAGKTLKAKTDKNGYATFKLSVKPKTYTVTVTYNKVSQKYKVTVKNVIKAKNVKVKKSAKKLKVKVTLKTSAKKPIKGKKVVLKIKGKKLKAKTNKKGVAKFKIKKNILKKLKAGKKYKYQVIYGKDKVKKTLKVKK